VGAQGVDFAPDLLLDTQSLPPSLHPLSPFGFNPRHQPRKFSCSAGLPTPLQYGCCQSCDADLLLPDHEEEVDTRVGQSIPDAQRVAAEERRKFFNRVKIGLQ
jgi:hypothetical protein